MVSRQVAKAQRVSRGAAETQGIRCRIALRPRVAVLRRGLAGEFFEGGVEGRFRVEARLFGNLLDFHIG